MTQPPVSGVSDGHQPRLMRLAEMKEVVRKAWNEARVEMDPRGQVMMSREDHAALSTEKISSDPE